MSKNLSSAGNLISFRPTKKVENQTKAEVLPPVKSLFHKIFRHPLIMPYNRLALLVTVVNAIIFYNFLKTTSVLQGTEAFHFINAMVLGNFALAILIRQQYVINGLFSIATSVPLHWPLWIRAACAKVYHFGGIHVGGFFSGTLWYGLAFAHFLYQPFGIPKVFGFIYGAHFTLLLVMIVAALPKLRATYHNEFEIIARFGGWLSLAFFWIQTLIILAPSETSIALAPQVWVLGLITFSVALPWMRLKKVPVKIDTPSSHVSITQFDYGVTPFAGSSTELSRNPLFEWHSFANIPLPDREGYNLTISRAGDWTGKLIDDKPEHIWVKGIPTAGVGNIETLFKKVLWVATGSGIGPCLPHLLANKVPSSLVWSTRTPEKTYGHKLVNDIKDVQPNAIIWDTVENGKPNMVELTYEAFKESGAEAVICISNKKLTWEVVYAMESRGIPAYGAIWDS